LIRNVIAEVNMFTGNGIQPGITLLAESLVALGLCSLLLVIEPLGALIVVSVLGAAAWGFYRLTRGRIARWGKARQHHDGVRLQHLQQGLGGAKDVTLLGRETDVLDQYRVHNTQCARVGQLHTTLQQFPRLGLELLAVSGLAILVISMLAQDRAARLLLEI
jgi:ABC-type transport system involved in cytochrome bd biosynthesis fused ATPase/permease subunit